MSSNYRLLAKNQTYSLSAHSDLHASLPRTLWTELVLGKGPVDGSEYTAYWGLLFHYRAATHRRLSQEGCLRNSLPEESIHLGIVSGSVSFCESGSKIMQLLLCMVQRRILSIYFLSSHFSHVRLTQLHTPAHTSFLYRVCYSWKLYRFFLNWLYVL